MNTITDNQFDELCFDAIREIQKAFLSVPTDLTPECLASCRKLAVTSSAITQAAKITSVLEHTSLAPHITRVEWEQKACVVAEILLERFMDTIKEAA